MLHNGNKILGHERSEESINLIARHLITLHDDGDENSLFVRFNELLSRVQDQEVSHEATWNSYVKALSQKPSNE